MAEISDAELERYVEIEAYLRGGLVNPDSFWKAKAAEALKPVYDPLVSDAEAFAATDVHCSQWHRQKLGALYLRKAADRLDATPAKSITVQDILRGWADAEENL